MPALSERKIAIVQTLVQTAPDRAVGMLERALANAAGDNPLVAVRRLVEVEVADRRLRNLVLQPLVPLCSAAAPPTALRFPSRTLGLIWRALKSTETDTLSRLRDQSDDDETLAHTLNDTMDRLVAAAAARLRLRDHPDFDAVGAICDADQDEGGARLVACLDIAAIVRKAVQRLPEWIMNPGGDTAAAARIAHRDAVAIADDAGPRFFHMLAGHLAHRWMVMRIISAVMDKPTERYLADSELAGFGEVVLSDVDQLIAAAGKLDAFGGPDAGRAAAQSLGSAVQQIVEVEASVDLTREHGWGKRIVTQRGAITAIVEARLRDAEKSLPEALPRQESRGNRGRALPRLTSGPEPRAVAQAETLLAFVEELRTSMNPGGFTSARATSLERLAEGLDQYAEGALELLRTESPADPDAAYAILQAAATLTGYVKGPKAAELILRRAGVALRAADTPQLAAGHA